MMAATTFSEFNVLLVEDNPGDVDLVRETLADLQEHRVHLQVATSVSEARAAVGNESFDAVLLDLNLPESVGLATLDAVQTAAPAIPVVVLTGAGDTALGEDAIRHGASDFIPEDEITGSLLSRSIRYAVQRQKRRDLEARFRGIIEHSRDLVTILNPDFTVQYITPSVTRLLGYSQEEKIGRDARVAHPDDAVAVEEEIRKLLGGPDSSTRIEHRVRHKEGGTRIFDTFVEDRTDDPAIGGLLLTSWDITELREREEQLRSARSRIEVLQRVSEIANQANRVEDTLETLVRELPELLDWDVGHVFLVEDGKPRSLPLWYPADSPRFRDFREATEATSVNVEEALVRQALETGEVRTMSHLPSNPDFARRDAAGALRRGVVIPIRAAGQVTALLELFSVSMEPVSAPMMELLRDIKAQLGQVAEREQINRKIRESQGLLRQLIDGVPDALFVKDRSGHYTLINRAGAEMVGRAPQDVIGLTDGDLFEPQVAEVVRRSDRRVMQNGEILHDEEWITTPDGRERVHLTTKGPLRDPSGNVTGMFGIARDISALTQTQMELNERVKELRCLYQGSQILGRHDKSLGERLCQLVENIPPGWLYPDVTEARITYGDSTFETDGFRETEWMLSNEIRARGTVIGRVDVALTEERAQPADGAFLPEEEELLQALVLAVEKALERDRLEAEFSMAQKMEAVGRLSAGVAHDFNNLLTIIRAHSEFVLLEEELPNSAEEELKGIQSAADRAAELTKQLLAFGREQILLPRPVDANDVVEQTERLAARTLGEDIAVELDLAEDLPAIEVDPTQFQQALLNLAVNARDAMPDGGRLTFRTATEVLTSDPVARHGMEPGPYVRLTVSDTGIGMDEETRTRVFEPFFSTKTDSGGTGLGLPMVHGTVIQSGGTIDVESRPGEGTTFILRFPAVEAAPESLEPADARIEVDINRTGRVLIVEDDDAVRRVTATVLERAGWVVEAVADVRAGLETLEGPDGAFDVVLTDLVLPGLSGRDLLERLQETQTDLALVAMSGYSEGRTNSNAARLPDGVRFIEKPFTGESLVQAVGEALAARREG